MRPANETDAEDGRPDAKDDLGSVDELLEEIGGVRPSQQKLNADQRTHLETFVDDGYLDWREFLVDGLFEVAWYSLGRYLKPQWYAHVGRENSVLACAITGKERTRYLHRTPSEEAAKRQRRRLAKKFLRPAFRAGYRELRANAQEYVQEENRVDPRESSMFAMRPVMHFYRKRQRTALEEFLDGFGSEGDLDAWLHEWDDATLGEVAKVSPELDWQLEMQSKAADVLLEDSETALRQREKFAAFLLLPAVARSPDVLLERSQELREEGDKDRMDYTQL